MAKHRVNDDPQPNPPREPLKKSYDGLMRVGILVGIALLVVISGMNLYETRRQRMELSDRMTQLAAAINTKPAAPPPQRPTGPDPEKVYTVKLEGAPFKGPSGAPITIAEFSEFQ
jgi:hypothetical protein